MRKIIICVAMAASISACASFDPGTFDASPLNGREIAPPGGWLEKSYDHYQGDVTGKPWICPDGRRARWLSGGWVEPTCAPDRP